MQSDEFINHQLVVSSLQANRIFKSIIVLAEGWPSWVYAISGLFSDARIYLASHSPLLKERHHHWFDRDVCWWNWVTWKEKASTQGLSEPILFCVQGSSSFGNYIFETILALRKSSQLSCIFAMDLMGTIDVPKKSLFIYLNDEKYGAPSISNKGYKSHTLSHSNCGGITKDKRRIVVIDDGVDLVSSMKRRSEDNYECIGSPIKRSLLHALDSTQNGILHPPKANSEIIFDKDAIIPISVLKNCWVRVPTVFSDSLIFRRLTMKELFRVKDLPTDMIEHMNRRDISSPILDLIIQAAPSKLLWECIKFYFTKSKPIKTSPKLSSLHSSNKKPKLNETDSISLSFKELLQVKDSEILPDEEMEVTSDGIPMKALKPDDAEADDLNWNEVLFRRRQLPTITTYTLLF